MTDTTDSEMVKRKWLCDQKVVAGETDSSCSMSSISDDLSEDQEVRKGSPCDGQSPEVVSETTCTEINGKGIDEGMPKVSLVTGDDGSKEVVASMEKASKACVDEDTQEPSHAAVNDGSNTSSPTFNASTISMDETSSENGVFEADDSHQVENVDLKFLRDKLSAALLNVSIKDDLVNQHSRVAEEAVQGWEKAEKDAAALKQQLDAAVESKSALEARVSHLDEALKECVRQLRLGRDEQERKITQAVAERTFELEAAKSKLEEQLMEIAETYRVRSPDPKLQDKVESLEKENVSLRQHLQMLCEELEVRSIERDLSAKAAETASKQHLESIKKVARLEAECRKLKSLSPVCDHRSTVAASSYVESLTDSQLDGVDQLSASESNGHKQNGWGSHKHTPSRSGSWISELDQFRSQKVVDGSLHLCREINLMDDFLEMEQLAGLPDTSPQLPSDCNLLQDTEKKLRAELNTLARRTAEMEQSIGKVEKDKAELELALAQTHSCLDNSEVQLIEAQIKLEQLERDVHGAIEGEQFYKTLTDNLEKEAEVMSSQIKSLHGEIAKERALTEAKSSRIEELERELKKKEQELEMQQDLISDGELKLKDSALAESQASLEMSQTQLRETEVKLKELEKELHQSAEEKESLASLLDDARAQVHSKSDEIQSLTLKMSQKQEMIVTLSTKIEEFERLSIETNLLNRQIEKERALVAQLSTQVKELDQKRVELEARQLAYSNLEVKIKQEDVAAAAGKLADCQKTIASLGSQLKSLATLEDFLIDTASIPGFSAPTPAPTSSPLLARHNSSEPWKLHSNDTLLSEKRLEPSSPIFPSHNGGDCRDPQAASSSSSAFFLNHPNSEQLENGFAKYFSISRN